MEPIVSDDIKEESRTEADAPSFMPGQRLRKAREQRGLSAEQVAQELHLALRFVNAIEADRYKELPEPAFVRGYMRRYAQLVKVSADDIAASFDQCYAADMETPPPDARPSNPIQLLGSLARPRLRLRRLLSWASLALLVALGLGFLWHGLASREAPVMVEMPVEVPASESVTVVPVVPAPAPATGEAPTAAVPTPAVAAPPVMAVLPSPSAPSPATLPARDAPPASAVTLGSGSDTLVIVLSAESWVSVQDALRSLVADLRPAGQTLTLKGQAPFQVNIGNAPAATLTLNGKPVDLRPHTRGAVATLTARP